MLFPLLSFIAHLKSYKDIFNTYSQDLTERGFFPCLISNQLDDPTNPAQSLTNKFLTLNDPSNRFFIFFLAESSSDPVALWELSCVTLGINTEHLCIVGDVKNIKLNFPVNAKFYDDWENLIHRHFFS